jgi:hypothetical protein
MKHIVAYVIASAVVLQATATFGQDAPKPAAAPLPAEAAAFQRDALQRLQERVKALAPDDVAKSTSLLRKGLSNLSVEADKNARALGRGSADAVVTGLDAAVSPSDIDRDPAVQSVVARVIEQSRALNIRMVGSEDAPAGSHRETVALLLGADRAGCSGVVIAAGAVLTAAHCVCELELGSAAQQVVFGDDIKAPDTVVFTIPEKTRIFPSTGASPASVYCANYKKFAVGGRGRVCDRDVALVQFDPAKMPTEFPIPRFAAKFDVETAFERITPGHGDLLPMEVVGFGVTRIDLGSATYFYGDAGRKRFGRFSFFFSCPGVPPFDCSAANSGYCMGGTEIVIQDIRSGATDSCRGDSGGAAFVSTAAGDLRLAALISRAVRSDGSCGPGGVYSSIYTDDIVSWLGQNDVNVTR